MSTATQQVYNQSRQQMLMFAFAMFSAIVAAVVVSTIIIMSLMRGEVASAAAEMNANQQPVVMGSCVDTSTPVEKSASAAKENDDQQSDASSASAWVAPVVPQPVNQNVYKVDKSQNYTKNYTDNSKGKTIVSNKTVTNNTVNQNGLLNVNLQDLSNETTQVVKPVNVIDNEVNLNSNNTDNSSKVVDSFNPVIVKDNDVLVPVFIN